MAASWFISNELYPAKEINLQKFDTMQQLITSYIIQERECMLKDVGRFKINFIAAESDIVNKQIAPRTVEINFAPREEKISDGLIKYVADKKMITLAQASDDVKMWCRDTKNKLINGEDVPLLSLGILKKSPSGIVFIADSSPAVFFGPVKAERVVHLNSEHAMLVGDKETTSSRMSDYLQIENVIKKNNTWKILAVLLFIIALFFLIIHFYGNPFSLSTIGNQNKIIPASAPHTYLKP